MKILLSIVMCFGITLLVAQKNEGYIEYTETIQLDINLEGMEDMPEEMKAMIPKEHSFNNKLYFNKKASFYTNLLGEENDKDINYKSDAEDIQLDIKMDAPERIYYKDLQTGEGVESQDLFGRKFLISGKQEKEKWQITSDKKMIVGFACQKATLTIDDETTEVWFTTQLPIQIGPSRYHQLPGVVLAVSLDGGKHTITASDIKFEKIPADVFQKPTKGKKVSRAEFKKIADAKMKEMQEEFGGDGRMIIKTEIEEH